MAINEKRLKELAQQYQYRPSTSGSGVSQARLQELINQRIGVQPKKKLFEGGIVSDVLDTLAIPAYAIGGVLSKKHTVKEAVKGKITGGEALGLKGIPRFLADVALDPLTYTGIGALTKAGKAATKAGKVAATLGQRSKLGESALLTFGGRTVVKGTPVMEAITRATNAFKSTPVGEMATKALRLGAPSAGKGATLREIEDVAQQYRTLKGIGSRVRATENIGGMQAEQVGRAINKQFTKLQKQKLITKTDIPQITKYVAELAGHGRSTVKLAPQVKAIADDILRVVKKEHETYSSLLDTPKLAGKALPQVPVRASREFLQQQRKGVSGGSRVLGGASPSEQFATYFKLGDQIVHSPKGRIATTINTEGMPPQKFIAISDRWFPANIVKQNTKQAIQRINKSNKSVRTVEDVVDLFTEKNLVLPKDAMEELTQIMSRGGVERVAALPDELNLALKSAGKQLEFSEDTALLVAELIKRTGKSKAKRQFITEVMQVGIPKTAKIPTGFKGSSLPELKGLIFPASIIEHIDKTYKAFSDIKEINAFWKLFDNIQGHWKGLATFVNPAFHTRNAISNIWQGYLGGVYNPAWYGKAGKLTAKVAKNKGKDLQKILTPSEYKLWNEYIENGLGGVGWVNADVDKTLKGFKNPIYSVAGAVGSFVEDTGKLAMYLQRRAKGFTPEAASWDVRKYFFDYADLSDFERYVLRRTIPFYTWTRNNLPLQIAMLIKQPGKILALDKARQAIQSTVDDKPLDDRFVPGWIKEGYPIFFGKGDNGLYKYFRLNGFVPTVDLYNLERPVEFVVENQLSPFIKAPFELVANEQFLFDKPIEEYEGELKEFLGVNLPAKWEYVARQIRPLSELNRLMDDKLTVGQRVGVGLAGAKFATLDEAKQRNLYDYLRSIELGKIKSGIEKAQQEGNIDAIEKLRQQMIETQQGFEIN